MSKSSFCTIVAILVLAAFVPARPFDPAHVAERPEFETRVVKEINLVRQKPWKYDIYISAYQGLLRGNVLYLPKRKPFLLYEGASVLQTARDNIVKRGITRILKRSGALDTFARTHLTDLLDDPELGHTGKDGADFATRVRRQIPKSGPVGENITFSAATPRQTLLTMIIDDGVESRQHRENIFNPDYGLIGVACGIRAPGQPICVFVFAVKISPKAPIEF